MNQIQLRAPSFGEQLGYAQCFHRFLRVIDRHQDFAQLSRFHVIKSGTYTAGVNIAELNRNTELFSLRRFTSVVILIDWLTNERTYS